MVFEEKMAVLGDGSAVVLRSPREEDAEGLLAYLDLVRHETGGIMFAPEDDLPTLEFERKWIRGNRESAGGVQVTAFADGCIVASCNLTPTKFYRQRHAAGLGISVLKAWHGRGLGTLLMRELIEWPQDHDDLELLHLTVFADNPAAIHVYEKVGFVHDGLQRRRVKRDSGDYADVVSMSLWLADVSPVG